MTILHAQTALTPAGWATDVQVTLGADGRISDVGPQTAQPDHRMAILLPAPLNLHSHSFQRAMAGLTEARGPEASDSFWTWRRLMYRFLDQLTPEDVEAIAAQAFMEMLEQGFAAVAEFHYLHHSPSGAPYDDVAQMSKRIIAAAQQSGIGLTLLPVLYQVGGLDGRALQAGQIRFGNDLDRFAQVYHAAAQALKHARADDRLGLAPHSLRAVSPAALQDLLPLAQGGPIHIHLAEQQAEVEEVQAHLGARPVEWLLANHDIGPNWCAIHCTQMTLKETRALAATGAVAGLCPLTEASLGDGIFNGRSYLDAGGKFGFGSDSNIQISLFEELKAMENSQRLQWRARAVMAAPPRSTGRVLFDASLAGGAQAGGRDSGKIAQGAWADLIGLDDDNAHLVHRAGDQILDSLIFGGGAGLVRDVFSAGRHLVQNGRHIARDQITAEYLRVMRRLVTTL